MRKSIKKILKEQRNNQDKIETLQHIIGYINEGMYQLNDTWGFDDAAGSLDEYFEEKGVSAPLRQTQHYLNEIFDNISGVESAAKTAIDGIQNEINNLKTIDTPVGNSGMDIHLRGGGSMGAL